MKTKRKTIKQKKCKVCSELFTPFTSLQKTCGVKCAMDYVDIQKEKTLKKELRERKKQLKTRPDWLKDAQTIFNKYIRKRDDKEPCISCGRFNISENYTGGQWDCGHYLTRGAYPELRFHPMNSNKQCKTCNGGSGKYSKKNSTVAKEYRKNLIKKIGLKNVEWLEGPHSAQNWSIDDLKDIRTYYKERLKDLDRT